MKRVLLVTYAFPPIAGSGTFRPLRLAKYLPRHGWDVSVLSVSSRVRLPKDDTLLADVPPGVEVSRTATLEPRNVLIALNRLGLRGLVRRIEPWFMVPDPELGWVPFARRRGRRLLRQRRFDAILTTAGPFASHLVGLGLARHRGVPWVADFRDEWTTNPYLRDRYPTAVHRALNRRLESRVLGAAARVTSVSRPWLETIRALAPAEPAAKFRVMPNGYDAEHFGPPPLAPPARFRILYTGAFYGHRSPLPFLESVRRVLRRGVVPADGIEVELMGDVALDAASSAGLAKGVLTVKAPRPYREAIARLSDAAVLLLVVPRAGGAGNHTGKLFQYLAAGRPILALAPEPNVAADLVRESRSGEVVPPDDPDAIAAAIETLYLRWHAGENLPQRDAGVVERYEADRQAGSWAALLDELPEPPFSSSPRSASTSRGETTSSE